jgi:hypothetical protein
MSTNGTHVEEVEVELVDVSTSLIASNTAQLDVQVTTAKAHPRSISKARETVKELACLDAETAASMFYTVPRDGKSIVGASIRFAEICAYSFGNIRIESDVVSIDDKHVTAQGTCFDLERNLAARVHVKQRITYKNGTRYSDDMIVTVSNSAMAKAARNAVFKVIPFSLVKPIFEQAMKTAVGNETSFAENRIKEFARWQKVGVSKEQLLKKLERRAVEDVTIEDLAILIGFRNAIREGDATVASIFSDGASVGAGDLNAALKAAAKKQEAKPQTEQAGTHPVVTEPPAMQFELDDSELEVEGGD